MPHDPIQSVEHMTMKVGQDQPQFGKARGTGHSPSNVLHGYVVHNLIKCVVSELTI